MNDFRERIQKLSPKRLELLALELKSRLDALERDQSEPLAIVGAGCRIPQAEAGTRSFWDLLLSGTDAVSQVPQDRWDASAWYDSDPDAPGRSSTTWGSFVSGVDLFDAPFFNISAREAATMDPQHRILLETCWEALENAGRSPRSLRGSSTGIFLGLTNSDYHPMLLGRGEEFLDTYVATGVSPSVAAGRIAYFLGLHGPTLTVDTACSASLVALHLACQSLRRRECNMALAGGVNLILSPEVTVTLSKAHMMAPDGRSKSFDASANGFVRGEGCGMVVLKRRSEAEGDGDRILALIRGSAVNQDGRSSGLTAPNGVAQEALLRQALSNAGLSAGEIDYIEAHGTGTALGDPIEAHALAAVFGPGRPADQPLVIGSVKTNVGHLEAAAGVAGLIKTVLALEHEQIPKHLHFRSMNPHIDWGPLAVEIPVEGRAWPRGERVRRAGVSSFGFSGTNAHVIVEEAPLPTPRQAEWERDWHLLALSARTPAALAELSGRYRRELAETAAELGDICFTANAGRTHFEERTFYLGQDRAQMLAAMQQPALRGRKEGTPAVAFLFSGQGAQYAGMGRELYGSQPVFRRVLEECAGLLRGELEEPLLEVLWGSRSELLGQTAYTQPALFALEYGLAEVWRSWGVEPAMVAGHSVGEYVAACVAGVYGLETGLKLIAARGRLMQQCRGRGVMSAVRAGEERVQRALSGWEARVSIAAVNAPASVVIAGYEDAVEQVEKALRAEGVEWKRLAVSHGFHSPQMDEMQAAFAEAAAGCEYRPPAVKWISGTTGKLVGSEGVNPSYWRQQVRQPVRWAQAMQSMEAEQAAIYLEVGPGTTLAGLGRQCVEPAERLWAASLRSSKPEWEQMLDSLGKIYLRGLDIDWDGYDRGYQRRRIPLPTYPFQRRHYWAESIAPRLPKSPASEPPANWFYQLSWEPKPALSSVGPAANAEAADFHLLRTTAERLRIETGFDQYDNIRPLLNGICAAFIVRAFRRLGCAFTPGVEFSAGDLARTLGVAVQHFPLFDRLLAILAEEGIVEGDGATRRILRDPDEKEPGLECHALASQFAPFRAEIEMLRRCGDALAEVLNGRTDPLQLLFSGGSFESAEQLYTESPGLRVFNELAASAIAEEIRRRPGRKLRILEIGAGTGATTGWIAAVLPPDRTEYCYTDVSAAFLSRAKAKFGQYPFFEYRTLDVERDPGAQGFHPEQFDIIIAANVLHATADLRITMRHVRSLLAPSGVVLLVEGIRRERWVDLTFGLTEGWWRFRDYDLRPSHPLLAQASWMDLLSTSCFCGAGAVRAADSQVALILARAPHTEITQRWLVVPDHGAVAAEFASRLGGLGGSVTMAGPEQSAALLKSERFDGVLYLSALDCPRPAEFSADSVAGAAVKKSAEILDLAQTVIKRGAKLWMVTRGAQQVAGSKTELNIAQAPVWGWAKTISLEHPNCWGGVIDLDPSASDRDSASAIADAVCGDGRDNEDQIAIRNGARYVPRLQRALAPPPHALPLSKGKIYLITGGLGGLGLRLALWMAQRGARHLLLVGRTGLPDRSTWDAVPADSPVGRKIAAVRETERFGAEVIVRAADISDEGQAKNLFASLSRPLGGILHLAAAGEMSSMTSMTSEDIRAMTAPKVQGSWNLHRLSESLQLDFFAMFSSCVSVFGFPELGHYSAANHFMDVLAHYRKSLGLPALSVNWGAWEDTAPALQLKMLETILSKAGQELRNAYGRGGFLPMPSSQAFTALYRTIATGSAQAVIAHIDWLSVRPVYETWRPMLLLEYASNLPASLSSLPAAASEEAHPEPGGDKAPVADEAQRPALRATIIDAPFGERLPRLVSYVKEVLSSVLGTSAHELRAETHTSELGLDSLMALEIRSRINAEFAIQITLSRLLKGLTISELASQIEAELPESTVPPAEQAATALGAPSNLEPNDSFPLSYIQRAGWFYLKLIPESSIFQVGLSAKASPSLHWDAFERAVSRLMELHPALRTVFFETAEGEPRQRVLTSWRPETQLVDASTWQHEEISEIIIREHRRVFDVRRSVLRVSVFRRNENDIILFSVHHLVVDASSVALCFGDLGKLYAAELGDRSSLPVAPRATYREFVAQEAEMVEGSDSERLWNYWKQELSGELPQLKLPCSRPRPSVFLLPLGECIPLSLGLDFSRMVREAARLMKVTTFSLLLAAYQALLCRYSGQQDLVIGTTSSSRDLPKWAKTVGYLINILPIRCDVSDNPSFADHLVRTRNSVLGALDHQGLPFPLMVERLRIRRDIGRTPVFQAFFNLNTDRQGDLGPLCTGIGDCTVPFGNSVLHPCVTIPQYAGGEEVVLGIIDSGEEITGNLFYHSDFLDPSAAHAMVTDYVNIVRTAIRDPQIRIADLPVTLLFQEAPCEELLL